MDRYVIANAREEILEVLVQRLPTSVPEGIIQRCADVIEGILLGILASDKAAAEKVADEGVQK